MSHKRAANINLSPRRNETIGAAARECPCLVSRQTEMLLLLHENADRGTTVKTSETQDAYNNRCRAALEYIGRVGDHLLRRHQHGVVPFTDQRADTSCHFLSEGQGSAEE